MTDRGNQVPRDLQEALRRTASSLGKTFKVVGSLNGKQDAPMPERNTVVHFGAALLGLSYAVYAEPKLGGDGRSGRADLLASNGALSYVAEVKTFGRKDLALVRNDAQRVHDFVPCPDDRSDNTDALEFWTASERWGVVLVQCFCGSRPSKNSPSAPGEFQELWRAQVEDPSGFRAKLADSGDVPAGAKDDFQGLADLLQGWGAHVGVEHISDDIWLGTPPLRLLWAAFRRLPGS